MKIKLLTLLLFMVTSVTGQQTYFVSSCGNDSADGSLDSPLSHIHEAIERGENSDNQEIHVYIREGKYYLDTLLVIDADKWKNKKLTLSAYNNESVVLSGARKLSSNGRSRKTEYGKARQVSVRVINCLLTEKKGFLPVILILKKVPFLMERLPMRLHQFVSRDGNLPKVVLSMRYMPETGGYALCNYRKRRQRYSF